MNGVRIEVEEFGTELDGERESFGVHLITYTQGLAVIRRGGALDHCGVWIENAAQLSTAVYGDD